MADENGVWRTISGRRVFIKEGQSLSDALRESGKFEPTKTMTEKEILRAAITEKLEDNDIEVNSDGTVTLYHATTDENYEKIMKDGFKGTTAPIGGGTGSDEVGARSFFGTDKKWVEETWGKGREKIIKIKVPVEYVRQGMGNKKEIYIEGNIRQKDGIWIPDKMPTSTAYDRLAIKRWKKKHDAG